MLKSTLSSLLPGLCFALIAASGCDRQQLQTPVSTETLFDHISPAVVTLLIRDNQGNSSSGSGFFVSEDGMIATNYHVIQGAAVIEVKMNSGASFKVDSTVATDEVHDLALLKVPATGLQYLQLGKSIDVKRGMKIVVLGSPRGLEQTFSEGIVSALRHDDNEAQMQITAPISPGSSGSPVVNTSKQVIGVVVSYFTGGQQLNFAVPVDYLSALILHPEPQPVMKGSFAELLNDSECPVNLPEVGNIADLKEPIRLLNVLNGWFEQQPTSNFHKMVNKYPNSPSAHLLLGLSLREHGLLEDAAKEVATSIELGEASADAQYILGSIIHTLYIARLDQGNATALLVQAEAALRKAVIMDETLDGAWCKLGLVCYKQDKYSEAKNAFQRYFESLKRKIEDNKEFYADLKKDFPSFNEYEDFYEAYLFYGMNARAMGEFTEAYNSLMQALQSPGADSRAYRELMDLYIDADDYAAGARVFRSAYGLYPRERDLLVRGIVCLVSIKAYVEARYYQRVLAAIDPGAARSFDDYFPQGQ